MFALDFATQAQQMKAIGGQPDYALGSVHAVTRDGTVVIASASGSQLASYAWGAANVIFVVGAQPLVPTLAAAHERIYQHSLPLDEKVDHVRGAPAGHLIIEYGDYECPYSRQAFHSIEQVEQRLGGNMRFAFRHFPLTRIHPHALAAAAAAEAAALQGRFWDMHELLFHRQKALEDGDLRRYAAQIGLDVAAFDRNRT